MGASGGSEREHDNLWKEVDKLRGKIGDIQNQLTVASLRSEKCEENVDKLHAQEITMGGMQRDVGNMAARLDAMDGLVKKMEGLPLKVLGLVLAGVPVVSLVLQLAWWLFETVTKKG